MQAALLQLGGNLSQAITDLSEELLAAIAAIEANLDFPDEVDEPGPELMLKLDHCLSGLDDLLARWDDGRVVREGFRLAIIGRPNVGKSSLLNTLLAEERAIVSDQPGTTRDTIEESLQIGGCLGRIVDTAGLRQAGDALEQEGVNRARRELARADVVLPVLDLADGVTAADREIAALLDGRSWILVANKADLADGQATPDVAALASGHPWLAVSAKTGQGIAGLREQMRQIVAGLQPKSDSSRPLLLQERHREALSRAKQHLEDAMHGWQEGNPIDLIGIDLRAAWQALGEITGRTTSEDLLDRIFSEFCIGK